MARPLYRADAGTARLGRLWRRKRALFVTSVSSNLRRDNPLRWGVELPGEPRALPSTRTAATEVVRRSRPAEGLSAPDRMCTPFGVRPGLRIVVDLLEFGALFVPPVPVVVLCTQDVGVAPDSMGFLPLSLLDPSKAVATRVNSGITPHSRQSSTDK